jgi:hypothetical protein
MNISKESRQEMQTQYGFFGLKSPMPILKFAVVLFLLNMTFSTQLQAADCKGSWVTAGLRSACDQIKNKLDNVDNKTQDIQSKTSTVFKTVNKLPTYVQSQLGISLDPDAKDKITSVFTDMQIVILEEKDNIENFGNGDYGTGCYDFKNDLLGIGEGLIGTSNQLLTLGGTNILPNNLDGSGMALLIEALPCPVLLPVDIAFRQVPIAGFASQFEEVSESINTLAPLYFDNEISSAAFHTQSTNMVNSNNACSLVDQRKVAYKSAAKTLQIKSLKWKLVAALLDPDEMNGEIQLWANKMTLGSEREVGLHGYGSVTIEHPKKQKRVAAFIKALSEGMAAIAQGTNSYVRHCEQAVKQDMIATKQDLIMKEICSLTRNRSAACQAQL